MPQALTITLLNLERRIDECFMTHNTECVCCVHVWVWISFTDLARCQSNLTELSRLLQSLEILQRTQSAPNFTEMQVKKMHKHKHTRTKQVKQFIQCFLYRLCVFCACVCVCLCLWVETNGACNTQVMMEVCECKKWTVFKNHSSRLITCLDRQDSAVQASFTDLYLLNSFF